MSLRGSRSKISILMKELLGLISDKARSGNRFFIDLAELRLDENTLRNCQIIVTVLT
jgi:hypothetical protein